MSRPSSASNARNLHGNASLTENAGAERGPHGDEGEESLTPLEREVLEEYVKLRDNLDKVHLCPRYFLSSFPTATRLTFVVLQLSPLLAHLSTRPTPAILDALRVLERKTSLVSTLLKASVYSIVLQQEMFEGNNEGQSDGPSDGPSQ